MKHRHINLLFFLVLFSTIVSAQSITYFHRDIQRIGNTFESALFGDNQTVLVPLVGTAEMDIMHRFGTINNGYSDLWGLYAPSNIRLGASYVPITNLMIGGGITKDRLLWDVNAKYAILTENGENPKMVSLSYYVNMAADTRDSDFFRETTDRLTFFHQVMIAKKVTRDFSVQAAASLTHFNSVHQTTDADGGITSDHENDHFAFNLMARYKISDAFAFMADYNQPITNTHNVETYPNICVGFEIATPMHSFQMFVGNYRWMVPQYNNMLNPNDYNETQFMLGFNITRLLDAKEESLYDMILKRHPKKDGAAH